MTLKGKLIAAASVLAFLCGVLQYLTIREGWK